MPDEGHFRRLLPLVSGVTAAGADAHFFTHHRFRGQVEAAGGRFVDLFASYPLDVVDDESIPQPCRFVTYAGHYATEVARELQALDVSLVVYDTFAVVGRVAAIRLGLPYANVCSGHNVDPARFIPLLEVDPRVSISRGCRRAVEVLRTEHGIEDASPFSYVAGLSPFLNVYCEPPAYLSEAEREVFEPVAFLGSLPSLEDIDARSRDPGASGLDGDAALKVYVSFGTVVWRYYTDVAVAALAAISDGLGEMPDVEALISLGDATVAADVVGRLTKPNVAVAPYVDQWRVLERADVFVTHQGMKSTHEAVFNRVPMLAYPFFADQPSLAKRCHEFGLSVPLGEAPRAPLTPESFRAALAELERGRDAMRARLDEARGWELEVMAARPRVVERILALARGAGAVGVAGAPPRHA